MSGNLKRASAGGALLLLAAAAAAPRGVLALGLAGGALASAGEREVLPYLFGIALCVRTAPWLCTGLTLFILNTIIAPAKKSQTRTGRGLLYVQQ